MNNNVDEGQLNRRNNFNNPFHLDPNHQDIFIEKKLNRDYFCPLLALLAEFGIDSDYYSIRRVNPLKESFFHAMQSLIFPNATLFQISIILCYIIIVVYIILLLFGLDDTLINELLPIKMSTADFGSFHPMKIKESPLQYYRLITFHFIHFNFTHIFFNLMSLISFCSFFETMIRKTKFILIFFLSGITSSVTALNFFEENERYCGINCDITGILGGFIMFYIINWDELQPLFGVLGRFLIIYIICVYLFLSFIFYQLTDYGNIIIQMISFAYGALFFGIFVKPIKPKKWKFILRISSIAIISTFIILSLTKFYIK